MLSTTESLVSSGPVFHLEMLNSRVTALVLLQKVVGISEKAAEIARIVRKAYWKNSANGFIETESKSAVDITDFKTLADVLIQAVITRELNQALPGISRIRGEENESFEAGSGATVKVEIKQSAEETSAMLSHGLQDNAVISKLSTLIHSDTECLSSETKEKLFSDHTDKLSSIEFDLAEIGVWIDPIDATAEYVKARKPIHEDGVFHLGLQCVTVIIGLYNTTTGVPIAGVINRPFNLPSIEDITNWESPDSWQSEIFWSVCPPDSSLSMTNLPASPHKDGSEKLKIAASAGESMFSVILNPNYKLSSPRGAGNKILTVATGHSDLYLITTDSNVVYRWDVCAGHGLLKSQGGAIISFKPTFDALKLHTGKLEDFDFSQHEIDYRCGHDPLLDGIVCYTDKKQAIRLFRDMLESERQQQQ